MKTLFIATILLLSCIAHAEDNVWLGAERGSWKETEYRKVKNDFAGWLLITSDLDWREKWETNPDTIPYFNKVGSVKVGQSIVILSFFVNPKINKNNETNVLCDIKVTRPDQTISVDYKKIICSQGKLQGNSGYIYLSPAIINYRGEPSDPLGKWLVEVTIKDVIRKTILNLKSYFILEKNG